MKRYLPMLIVGILALTCVNLGAEEIAVDADTLRITEEVVTIKSRQGLEDFITYKNRQIAQSQAEVTEWQADVVEATRQLALLNAERDR